MRLAGYLQSIEWDRCAGPLNLLAGVYSARILTGSATAQQAVLKPPGISIAELNTVAEIALNAMRLTGTIQKERNQSFRSCSSLVRA